jgi:tetratricopeptide (TPR) repeat protein
MRSLRLAAAVPALAVFFASGPAGAQTSTGPIRSDRTLFPNSGLRNPLVTEGDRWYGLRQDGRLGVKASVGPINQAISFYDRAAGAPDLVEARWKLARALYFKGVYCGLDPDARKAVFVKARRVSEDAIGILNRSLEEKGIKGLLDLTPDLLAGKLADRTDAAPTYFWAAASWGQWALSMGKVEAAKTGAVDKVREYALTVIALDPTFEEGGGYRILGRLHDEAPWIPIITPWVSREEALRALRLAMQVDPRNIANQHYLAAALAKGDAAEKAEAVTLEEAVVSESPSPLHLIEDLTVQDAARANLAAWKKGA